MAYVIGKRLLAAHMETQ